jgi:hypothetical protein
VDPRDTGPVTLRDLGAEFSAEYLQWDRGLPGTFRAVTLHAGAVARDYLERRGRRWVRPLRYLLLSMVASVAVSWLVYERLGLARTVGSEAARDVPFLLEHAALLTLAVLPLVALALRAAFHGLGVRYVDALVLLGYTQAQVNWFGLLGPLALLAGAPPAVAVALGGVISLWLVWSWARFGIGPAWRRWLAAIITLVVGQALNGAVVWSVLALWRLWRD